MDNKILQNYFLVNILTNQLKNSVSESQSGMFDLMLQSLLEKQTTNYINNNQTSDVSVNNSLSLYNNILLDKLPLNQVNYSSEISNINIDTNKTYNKSKESMLTINEIINNLDNIENTYTPAEGSELNTIYDAVNKYCKEYGVDKNLVLAIIKQESNFNPNAVSYAGAMGLMQLMDFNCKTYNVEHPLDIEENIKGGVRHIKEYLNMYDGNVEMALMAYNGGPGTMSRRGVNSAEELYKMPQETQNYVPKVMNYYKNGYTI